MLLGEYEHTIDEKGRITLPSKFREHFRNGIVLTRGMDRCLFAYTPDEWQKLVQNQLASLNPFDADSRKLQRFFFSGAAQTTPDSQGRVMLPSAPAQRAALVRDVVIAGVYDHLEIWDLSAWQAQMKEIEEGAEDVAERVAAKRD
jgi:MraZ protein